VRLAMAMYTMCDCGMALWREAAETETERHEKDLAVAGGQDCHGAIWSDSGRAIRHLGRVNQVGAVGIDNGSLMKK
jgi:hypothetical protein